MDSGVSSTSSAFEKVTAAEQRRLVEAMISHRGIYAPQLDAIPSTANPSTLREVQEQLRTINDHFRADLTFLHEFEARVMHEAQEMTYFSYDYIPGADDDYAHEVNRLLNPTENDPPKKLPQSMKGRRPQDVMPASAAANILRAAHALDIASLKQKERSLLEQDKQHRAEEEKFFPSTPDEFRKMRADLRLRVVAYLTANSQDREAILSKYNWASRQTAVLARHYDHNEQFKAEVRDASLNSADAPSSPDRKRKRD